MKRLLTLLIAIAVLSGISFAQTVKAPLVINEDAGTSFVPPALNTDLQDLNTPKFPGDRPLVDVFIDTVRDATFSFYGFVTPVVYEPNSNTLIQVQNWRYVPEGGSNLYGSVYIKYSQNYGQSWTKREFYDQVDHIPVWPSIAVMNTSNATNPDDFNYVITAPVAIEQAGSYPWAGDIWLVAEGGNPEVTELILDYPVEGQRWFWTRAAANEVAGDEVFYNAGTLTNSPGYQYGQYGSSAFNFSLGDFTFQGTPDAWALDKFRPSNDINSSYNDYLYVDVDEEGNAYVGVRNMFADDPDNRIPAVSKSTDGGETWSEFDRMPVSLLENYFTVYGGDPTKSGMIPYKAEGFVVWGTDSWSFLFRTFIYKAENDYEFHIVEAYKANGAWGIRKVADFSGGIQFAIMDVGSNGLYKDSLASSRLGNEVQVVRTKDSKYLVAKWVDYVDTVLVVDPPIQVASGDNFISLDTIQSNDVFMAYRETANPNWGQAMNVSNDPFIDKCTYLPLVIPDLEHVPLFQMSTFMSQSADPNNPRNSYPPNGWQLIVDTWQGLGFSNINLTGIVSVEEEENYEFSVNEVYPNPANDFAELTFNLDKSSFVNVEVYNAMGQKVNTLLNQILDMGLHGLTIDLSSYSSGSYYIRMTVNGHSITKALSVIH